MESLSFSKPIPDLILSGERNTTWRINDEKGFVVGDIVSLCVRENDETDDKKVEFSKARIISVKETKFKDLGPEDIEGHGEYPSEDAMYRDYSRYYSMKVVQETKVKVIKFKTV